jgi:hypothetical protein
MTGPTHRFKQALTFGHDGAITPLQVDFSHSAITRPTHRFKWALTFGHDGAITPLQADFSHLAITGPTHRLKRAFNFGRDGAITLLRADFLVSNYVISDRRSSLLPEAAPLLTMPPEACRGSIASVKAAKTHSGAPSLGED